jgi:hypothetical protein
MVQMKDVMDEAAEPGRTQAAPGQHGRNPSGPDAPEADKPAPGESGSPRPKPDAPEKASPAGPHDRPELTNEDATPGAGAMPDDPPGNDVDPGSG